MNQLNEQFLAWLKNTPEAIAHVLAIAKQWYEDQGKITAPAGGSPLQPHEYHAGEKVALTTVPITDAELEAVVKGYAEAEVKERAIKFVEGFLLGVAVAA